MDTPLTDEACDRLLAGQPVAGMAPVAWLVEDLRALYLEPVPRAVQALHPSGISARPGHCTGSNLRRPEGPERRDSGGGCTPAGDR